MLKNPDRSGDKPESAHRFCHALRSEAGGAFDISTRGGAKLAERSTYPREVERSWRSVRHVHERRSEAGGAFDISTRRDVKSPAYPHTFQKIFPLSKSFAFLKSL